MLPACGQNSQECLSEISFGIVVLALALFRINWNQVMLVSSYRGLYIASNLASDLPIVAMSWDEHPLVKEKHKWSERRPTT